MSVFPVALVAEVVLYGVGGFGPFLDDGQAAPAPAEQAEDTGLPACDAGVLREGMQLQDLPGLLTTWNPDRSWGTPELVDALTQAAEEVGSRVPGADPLVVGDMSRERGGQLYGHRSHRDGIDADLGLYFGDGRQGATFEDFDPAAFDPATNWVLIRSLLATGLVERILLDETLVQKLRAHLARTGELTAREIELTFPRSPEERFRTPNVVHHAPDHRDHMHVRVVCVP